MKFTENNRISHRQLYRQMVLTFLAPFLLCLPGEGALAGREGVVGILAALPLLAGYVILLMRMVPWYTDPVKNLGPVQGRLAGLFFLSYVLLTGAYLLDLMAELIPEMLVPGVPGIWIAFLAACVCSFGTHRGMQRRGRMAEVSGGLLLGGIVLMMVLCLGQSRISYLQEMQETALAAGDIPGSFYTVLCAFSGLSLLPFMLKDVEKRGTAGKTLLLGITALCGILAGMLLLLPAVLGQERLASERYPVLPLMAGADLPGNVLARFDVLWAGFLLYSLLFALGSLFHYGHQITERARLGSGRWWIPAAVFLLGVTEFGGTGIRDYYGFWLTRIFFPGMLLLQAYMAFRGRRKWNRKAACACAVILSGCLFLGGCGAVEPEKRMYPLALGVNTDGQGFRVIYGMPDLPRATGQEKQEEGGSLPVLSIQGADFQEIQKRYDRSQEKYLDISHIQVILLGNALVENGRWQEFLSWLKQEPFMGENVYLFSTEDPEAVLALDGEGSSMGEFLTGLLENRLPGQQKEGVTLRQVYHLWYQEGALMHLPVIKAENDSIQVFFPGENKDG